MHDHTQNLEAIDGKDSSSATGAGTACRATPLQERHWFLHQYESDPSTQNCAMVVELRGSVSADTLGAATTGVLRRHPELCQSFQAVEGQLWRRCSGDLPPDVQVTVVKTEAELLAAAQAAQRRSLDLSSGRTCSVQLIQLDERFLVCLMAHACVADRRSLETLVREVAASLGAVQNVAPGPAQSGADSTRGTEADAARDEDYWLRRMGRDSHPLELPALAPRPLRKRYDAGRATTDVATAVVERVHALSEATGCSPYPVYLAAFLGVLRRWTGQDVVTVGRLVDLRGPERQSAIGPHTEILPLRVDLQDDLSFPSLVRQVAHVLEQDAAHSTVSLRRLTQLLDVERDPSRHPLFQAAFHYSDEAPLDIQAAGWTLTEAPAYERVRTGFDVELQVRSGAGTVTLTALFDEALFHPRMMHRFLRHCLNLIERADAVSTVDTVDILDADERSEIASLSRGPDEAIAHTTVHQMYQTAWRDFAESPAVVHDERVLSHRALETLSNRIASTLQALGAQRGCCVGICMHRSIEMVATVLAVLKTGAAYVPMDPAYPPDRLRIMAEDASTRFVVAHRTPADRFPSSCPLVIYEELEERIAEASAQPDVPDVSGDDLAYVIFTSGSTGRPKGVAMPHRALVNLLEWQVARRPFSSGAVVLQYSSLSFDVSFQEIFSTLITGGTLHLIDDSERRDPRRLLEAINRQRIRRLFLPYVALRQMIEVAHATHRYPDSLEEVITAGEQLRVDDALKAFFRRLEGASLDNQYGPSETHVVTAHMLEGDPSAWPALPPIGRPIRNTQTLVLDHHGAPVPQGVQGELYLAGANVAHGYLGRDDLTREHFVSNPLASGPAYRTGDAVRFGDDGSLEFLGRTDFQVKVRGHRIEPNEINQVLGRLPGVKQCLTRAVDDQAAGKRLVSYVLVDDTSSFEVDAAFRLAGEVLPEYMLPSAIVPLTELPFTPSGKVDIRALPETEARRGSAGPLRPPGSTTEQRLLEIWRQLLHASELGIDDGFFDVGGDSLIAVQLFLEIERRFGLDLPLSTLVENPTIASLAAVIDADVTDEFSRFRSLRRIQRGAPGQTPLFLVHGGGGNVVLFGELARAVSAELPVYAFEWDGWSGRRGCSTIEQMVDLYMRELLAFQPQGPYRLGGHCVGGLIALEMARRLRQQRHQVIEPVIVTDAPNLSATSYQPELPHEGSNDFAGLEALREELRCRLEESEPHPGAAEASPAPPARHDSRTRRRLVRYLKQAYRLIGRRNLKQSRVNRALDRMVLHACRLTGRRVPFEYRPLYATTTIAQAVRAYRPIPSDTRVLYFRTGLFFGNELGLSGWWSDTCLGFAELCRGGMEVHFVNASHNGVIEHPGTARIIRESLSP